MRVRAFLLAVLVLVLFPAVAAADYPHIVQPGETLTSVAATDDVSIEAIAAANGISPRAELIAGQTLLIPPQTAQNAVVSTTSSVTAGSGTATGDAAASDTTTSITGHRHLVLPGETLTSVAAATGVSIDAIAAANRMSPRAELIAGQTLVIPTSAGGGQPATSPEPVDNEANEEGAENEGSSSRPTANADTSTPTTSGSPTSATTSAGAVGRPQPTPERVSGAEIAGVADANGVPAALAEAIAWEESGWNNDEVSPIGAVGVMQIVPTTWSWIDRYLTPSDPLGIASASENVRAGVLLLHQLLGLTGGDEALAVAGYYQGLGSVQAHGMYADTRHYVANVLALAQRF